MSTKTRSMQLVALFVLTACADPRLGSNTKTGWVTELYSRDRLLENRPKCLAILTDAQISERQYAEIKVPYFRSYRYLSAVVSSAIEPQLHDKVEISPPSCESGTVPKVVQILERHHK